MNNEARELVLRMRRDGHTIQIEQQFDEHGNLLAEAVIPCVLTCRRCLENAASHSIVVYGQ